MHHKFPFPPLAVVFERQQCLVAPAGRFRGGGAGGQHGEGQDAAKRRVERGGGLAVAAGRTRMMETYSITGPEYPRVIRVISDKQIEVSYGCSLEQYGWEY